MVVTLEFSLKKTLQMKVLWSKFNCILKDRKYFKIITAGSASSMMSAVW